jgi:hypothetical protein
MVTRIFRESGPPAAVAVAAVAVEALVVEEALVVGADRVHPERPVADRAADHLLREPRVFLQVGQLRERPREFPPRRSSTSPRTYLAARPCSRGQPRF